MITDDQLINRFKAKTAIRNKWGTQGRWLESYDWAACDKDFSAMMRDRVTRVKQGSIQHMMLRAISEEFGYTPEMMGFEVRMKK